MARLFSTAQTLSQAIAVVSGPPFTFSAWINTSVRTNDTMSIMALIGSNQNNRFSLVLSPTGIPQMQTLFNGGGSIISASTGAIALSTWVHVAGVWASSSSIFLYVNGLLAAQLLVQGVIPGVMSSTWISGLNTTASGHAFVGSIALSPTYSIALAQPDVTALATNFADPRTVQGASLASFPKLTGLSPEPDTVLATPWAVNGASTAVADPNAAIVTNLASSAQTLIPVGLYSYYLQPWKSYLDTWPGTRLLDGIGVNYRPGTGNESAGAQVLGNAGVTHARLELGWGNLDYNNPTQLLPSKVIVYTAQINALKAAGIRPLILLNANVGGPCPTVPISLTPTVNAAAGARTITVSATSGIVLGKTGLTGQKTPYQGYPLIISIAGNVCTLSAPLNNPVTAGVAIPCNTYLYHPLSSSDLAGPFSAETKLGWAQYTTAVCNFVSGLLGNNNFDIEVWNELASDSAFLDSKNWYNPVEATTGALTYASTTFPGYTQGVATTGQSGREVIASISVDAAHAFPGVRVVNGLANQRPQDNAFNTPPGIVAFSRHYYSELNESRPINDGNSGISNSTNAIPRFVTTAPINAVFGYDGTPAQTNSPPAGPNSAVNAGSYFIPNFILSCPESQVGLATYYQYMSIEVQPFPSLRIDGPGSTAFRGPHWRGGVNPTSNQTVATWETETNSDRSIWVTDLSTATGVPVTDQRIIDLVMFIGAKVLLRIYTFHIHKGVQNVFVFADRNVGNPLSLSIVPEAFYAVLAGNGGVLSPAALAQVGTQLTALGNLTSFISSNTSGAGFTVAPVAVTSIIENSPGAPEWVGDGTPAHPSQFNVNNFGVFPFQLDASTYAIGYYVVSHDLVKNQAVNANLLDPLNYVMPDEPFILNLSGFDGTGVTVTCYDPLKNTSPQVTINSQTASTLGVSVLATDSPRFLLVTGTGGIGVINAAVQLR